MMHRAVIVAVATLLGAASAHAQSQPESAPAPSPETPAAVSAENTAGVAEISPDMPLSLEERKAVQERLQRAGFYKGPIDGEMNASTRAALRAFQKANLLVANGRLTAKTLDVLGLDVLQLTSADIELVRGEDRPTRGKKAKRNKQARSADRN